LRLGDTPKPPAKGLSSLCTPSLANNPNLTAFDCHRAEGISFLQGRGEDGGHPELIKFMQQDGPDE